MLSRTSVWLSGGREIDDRRRRAEVRRRHRRDRLVAGDRVDAVLALVVRDERDAQRVAGCAARPARRCRVTVSVHCRSSPLRRSSVQTFGMLRVARDFRRDRHARIDRRRREHDRVVVVELGRRCRRGVPNVSCFFCAGREVELEELVVAADARRVDDRLAVGRERRRVVGDRVLGDVRRARRSRRRRVKMSADAVLQRRRTRRLRPSGLNAGDSGPSTLVSSKRRSISPATTFWRISVLFFSVRAKYAMRSPTGAQAIHGTRLPRRPPAVAMYSKPRSLSKPLVRLRMTWPSLAESSTMSSSWSSRLPTTAASMSPRRRRLDREHRRRTCVRSGLGREVAAVVGRPLLVAERLEPLLQVAIELLVELLRLELERFFVGALAAADARSCAARTGTAAGLPCPTAIR